VFAELIPELVNWQCHLEGWEVREGWEGELRARRAYLLEGLSIRLGGPAPEPVRLAIEGTDDLEKLGRWFRALFTVSSWADFEALLKQE
jgi:hypothetical protein